MLGVEVVGAGEIRGEWKRGRSWDGGGMLVGRVRGVSWDWEGGLRVVFEVEASGFVDPCWESTKSPQSSSASAACVKRSF